MHDVERVDRQLSSARGAVAMVVLRAAVAIGLCVDAVVALLALFFQSLLGPLFDIPLKDPALTTIVGGEYVVVTLIYALILRAPERYRALLWLIALDQLLAALLPAIEIARGNIAATWKTIGPIPMNALLASVYTWGALGFPFRAPTANAPGIGDTAHR